jgi:hypothetical protein
MSICLNTTKTLKKKKKEKKRADSNLHMVFASVLSAMLPIHLPLNIDVEAKYSVHLHFAFEPSDMAQISN